MAYQFTFTGRLQKHFKKPYAPVPADKAHTGRGRTV